MIDIDKLNEDQKQTALRLADYLKKLRECGLATPENPKNGKALRAAAAGRGVKIAEPELRDLIHWLRTVKGVLIISIPGEKDGYSWTDDPEEFKRECEHLRSRAIENFEAYYLPLKRFTERQTIPLDFPGSDNPTVQALIREMDARPI